MKYALVFAALGMTCFYGASTSRHVALQVVLLSCAFCWLGVGAAYGFNNPQLFGKKRDGTLRVWSWIWFWPYHALNALTLQVFRWTNRQRWTKIDEQLYLGCQLNRRDEKMLREMEVVGVLDLTCEFAEIATLRRRPYLCIALLDTTAPTISQLNEGVQWIIENASQDNVYVHCALGHGRSATFVAAYLIKTQKMTVVESVQWVSARRHGVQLSVAQLRVLDAWSRDIAHSK